MVIKETGELFPETQEMQDKMNDDLQPVVRYWILHTLVPLGGMKSFLRMRGFHDEDLAESLGLVDADNDGCGYEYNKQDAMKELRRLYKIAEREKARLKIDPVIVRNVENVARLVGLSEVDCRLLEFILIMETESALSSACDLLGQINTSRVILFLSSLLGLEQEEIRNALHYSGVLASSGFLTLDHDANSFMRCKLNLMSSAFVDAMCLTEAEPLNLLRETVIPSRPPLLKLEDYQQISQQLEILLPYLRQCIASRKAGVNILLYGEPGVGKTQLVRLLAELTSTELFEISSESDSGHALEGGKRLNSFRAAQYFLRGRQSLLMFDEVEDIFAGGGLFAPRSIADKHKGWMNKMLEENPVPTFWLSNDISSLDNAFLRRFDMAIEVCLPGSEQRYAILQKQCGDFIQPDVIKRIADVDTVTPAVTERAVAVIRAIREELPPSRLAPALEMLINSTLETQGHRRITAHNPNKVPELYDPAFINADKDLTKVYQGLLTGAAARLCLYGPPGTGKTAFGKYLSESLKKPLHVKRASDLLSKWVGGTEQNIAKAFEAATREEAILLIDEVDSFLQDRRGANHSWEVTAVNEMLTQMETFNGIFIASTNLMSGLDQASLRRFDLKVEFSYLLPEQAWQLFQRYCGQLGLDADEGLRHKISSFNNLTPGDFAAVGRQNNFSPLQCAADLLNALESESRVKESAPRRGIGFITH